MIGKATADPFPHPALRSSFIARRKKQRCPEVAEAGVGRAGAGEAWEGGSNLCHTHAAPRDPARRARPYSPIHPLSFIHSFIRPFAAVAAIQESGEARGAPSGVCVCSSRGILSLIPW